MGDEVRGGEGASVGEGRTLALTFEDTETIGRF